MSVTSFLLRDGHALVTCGMIATVVSRKNCSIIVVFIFAPVPLEPDVSTIQNTQINTINLAL